MLSITVNELLPQKYPFRMVDTLIELNEDVLKSTFTILADNVMVEDGEFSAGGLLENMAQTMAAGSGYRYHLKNQAPPKGYIGAIKKVEIINLPKIGDCLLTETKTLHVIGDASIVEAKIFLRDELLAKAELTIFVSH